MVIGLKLLVVEDDRDTSDGVCEYFKEAGYEVSPAYDGAQALELVKGDSYDLILLDVMLPRLTGLAVLHELRKTSDVPVLMLTAIGDEYTQIASFDGLADDYVTKPFSIVLLEKRVAALLRRGKTGDASCLWQHRDVTVDFSGFIAQGAGGPIDVTPREVMLLRLLVEHRGRVLTRERILDELWGEDRPVFDRTVDSHIKNLRKKLHLDCIVTITGVGYKLEDGR
ncbi:Response regulator MprA [bioreactor metagenome]|uniref:Response regulator MprA n=1 Tax=bioreactor metagenome TaxID=1076179 RepID=A0A644XIG7_9ZZZZ